MTDAEASFPARHEIFRAEHRDAMLAEIFGQVAGDASDSDDHHEKYQLEEPAMTLTVRSLK